MVLFKKAICCCRRIGQAGWFQTYGTLLPRAVGESAILLFTGVGVLIMGLAKRADTIKDLRL